MKRVLSGVQPTGTLHLGNYLGALVQWRRMQDVRDCFFCVVDLHAITIPGAATAAELRENILKTAATYIACGIDPDKATIYAQSKVREHTELGWVLTCLTPVGWMHRMPQYASKSASGKPTGGLLCYPVLQAADILLYGTDEVPVGDDQKSHIDLARDIAQKFNHLYGDTFKLPVMVRPPTGARIMSLGDPTSKMSKSVGSVIGLLDTPKQVKKEIGRAVTDSGNCTIIGECSPGVTNLITIISSITGEDMAAIGLRFNGKGYGYLKKEVIEAVESALEPIRARYVDLRKNDDYLRGVLDAGAAKARGVAAPTMATVRERVGLGY